MSSTSSSNPGTHALDFLAYRAEFETYTLKTAQLHTQAQGKSSTGDIWRVGSKLYDELPPACRKVQEHLYLYDRLNGKHGPKIRENGQSHSNQTKSPDGKALGKVNVVSSIPVPPVIRRAKHQNFHPRFDDKNPVTVINSNADYVMNTDIPNSSVNNEQNDGRSGKVKREYEPLYYRKYGIYGELPVYPDQTPLVVQQNNIVPPKHEVYVNGQKVVGQSSVQGNGSSQGGVVVESVQGPSVEGSTLNITGNKVEGQVTEDLYATPQRNKNVARVYLD